MISTVISDSVLAAVTLACAIPLLLGSKNPTRSFGAGCLVFIAMTAAVGAARYAGADVELFHRSMSWTSKMIAVPMLGCVFLALALGQKLIRPIWYGVGLALGGIGWLLPPTLAVVPGSVGMALILVGAALAFRFTPKAAIASAVGVILYVTAGLVIGTKGMLGPMQRVDVFHYALAIAHPAITYGMVRARIR